MEHRSFSKSKYWIKFIFDGGEFCQFSFTKLLLTLLGQEPKPTSFCPVLFVAVG